MRSTFQRDKHSDQKSLTVKTTTPKYLSRLISTNSVILYGQLNVSGKGITKIYLTTYCTDKEGYNNYIRICYVISRNVSIVKTFYITIKTIETLSYTDSNI